MCALYGYHIKLRKLKVRGKPSVLRDDKKLERLTSEIEEEILEKLRTLQQKNFI